jgi:hypothetical protein
MNTYETTPVTARQSAVNGLAVFGFIMLIVFGIWLAIYVARFVPTALSRIDAAGVYLASVFVPAPAPGLSVVSTATTTLPFETTDPATTTATSTVAVATTTPVKRTPPSNPVAGNETGGTYQVGNGQPSLYGLPDLAVTIDASGYLTSSSTSSFVAATTIPAGDIPAVEFTVKNVGTNTAAPWRFSASIPTATNYIYQSIPQQSLNPGDYIDYTLGFSQPTVGTNETISVTANFDHAISESSTANDSASTQVTIQ